MALLTLAPLTSLLVPFALGARQVARTWWTVRRLRPQRSGEVRSWALYMEPDRLVLTVFVGLVVRTVIECRCSPGSGCGPG